MAFNLGIVIGFKCRDLDCSSAVEEEEDEEDEEEAEADERAEAEEPVL